MQQTTKFRETTARGRTLKTQIVLYSIATLLSIIYPALFGWAWWTAHHHAPGAAATATPTPAPVIPPAQVEQPTPEPPTDAMMAEWRHVPPGQEQNYAAYERRREAAQAQQQQPTPKPFVPYLPPEVVAAATPDPVAARYSEWKTMRDAYAKQQLVRAQNAKTDAERGQIQADVARWRANNPEPPKPKATPNEGEIPIR